MLDDTMRALRDAALAATDAGGHFPAMYARVTERVARDAAAGRFDDPDRMGRFVRAFAQRYLDARNRPGEAGVCWTAAFEAARDQRLLVTQHLLLGINAHVNVDLPLTVAALADRAGAIAPIRADFDTVNAVLADTYTDLIRDLDRVTRWCGRAASMGGGHLFNFSLRRARAQAWASATALYEAPGAARAVEAALLDQVSGGVAYVVTRPTVPFAWIVPLLRRLETKDPATVTRALLGPLA